MKKRSIVLLLALVLILTACSKNQEGENSIDESDQENQQTQVDNDHDQDTLTESETEKPEKDYPSVDESQVTRLKQEDKDLNLELPELTYVKGVPEDFVLSEVIDTKPNTIENPYPFGKWLKMPSNSYDFDDNTRYVKLNRVISQSDSNSYVAKLLEKAYELGNNRDWDLESLVNGSEVDIVVLEYQMYFPETSFQQKGEPAGVQLNHSSVGIKFQEEAIQKLDPHADWKNPINNSGAHVFTLFDDKKLAEELELKSEPVTATYYYVNFIPKGYTDYVYSAYSFVPNSERETADPANWLIYIDNGLEKKSYVEYKKISQIGPNLYDTMTGDQLEISLKDEADYRLELSEQRGPQSIGTQLEFSNYSETKDEMELFNLRLLEMTQLDAKRYLAWASKARIGERNLVAIEEGKGDGFSYTFFKHDHDATPLDQFGKETVASIYSNKYIVFVNNSNTAFCVQDGTAKNHDLFRNIVEKKLKLTKK